MLKPPCNPEFGLRWPAKRPWVRGSTGTESWRRTCSTESGVAGYFVFNLPLGTTVVVGGIGREDAAEESFGGLLSFFGFFAILLLRCSPLGMLAPD